MLRFLVYFVLPRPLARGCVAGLIYLGMLTRRFRFVGPRIIQISLPASCDHNCAFCITDIHGEGKSSLINPISFGELTAVIDKALSECTLNFNFVSIGEPALYPKIRELIEYIASKSRGRANIKLVTNGTSVHRIGVPFSIKNHVYYWVSLHAGDFATWNKIHRPFSSAEEKFLSMKSFLKELCATDPSRVTLHNVVHQENQNALDSIVDFAVEVGAKDIFWGRLYKFESLQLTAEEESEFYKKLKALEPQLLRKGIKNNISTFVRVAFSQKPLSTGGGPQTTPHKDLSSDYYQTNNCYIPWLLTQIDSNRGVKFCGAGFSVKGTRSEEFQRSVREASHISQRRLSVTGCDCQNCPHIQMNEIANRYLPRFFRNTK